MTRNGEESPGESCIAEEPTVIMQMMKVLECEVNNKSTVSWFKFCL